MPSKSVKKDTKKAPHPATKKKSSKKELTVDELVQVSGGSGKPGGCKVDGGNKVFGGCK